MPGVHFLHAGFIDFRAFGDASDGCAFLVLFIEFFMQDFFFLCDHASFLLFVLFETHYKLFECFFVGFLDDEILDGGIVVLAVHV